MFDPALLDRARAAAAEVMTDQCSISRSGPANGPVDPATGKRAEVISASVYAGPCRLRSRRITNPTARAVAGDFPVTESMTISIPIGAAVLQVQDVVTITASQFDAQNVGRRFRITAPDAGSQRSADRWQIEGVVG